MKTRRGGEEHRIRQKGEEKDGRRGGKGNVEAKVRCKEGKGDRREERRGGINNHRGERSTGERSRDGARGGGLKEDGGMIISQRREEVDGGVGGGE